MSKKGKKKGSVASEAKQNAVCVCLQEKSLQRWQGNLSPCRLPTAFNCVSRNARPDKSAIRAFVLVFQLLILLRNRDGILDDCEMMELAGWWRAQLRLEQNIVTA